MPNDEHSTDTEAPGGYFRRRASQDAESQPEVQQSRLGVEDPQPDLPDGVAFTAAPVARDGREHVPTLLGGQNIPDFPPFFFLAFLRVFPVISSR